MCKPNDQLEKERTSEPLRIEMQTEQVEQQLAPQQMEQQVEEAPVERQEEVEQNLALQTAVREQLPAARAAAAAPGAPVQEQAPAKRTWKQRQRDKRHAKIARRNCPLGTAVTYDMVTPLQALRQRQDQTMKDHADGRNDVDVRVLRTFSTGYALDKKGNPATGADAAAKQADDRFFADYCSKDLERRKPHLERMVNELLSVKFSADMLSEDNMRAHAVELKLLGDKMVYMENVMDDPINKPFFDQLDPIRKDQLKTGFDKIYIPFVGAMSARYDKYGVDYNRMEYYREAEPIRAGRMRDPMMHRVFVDAAAEYAQTMEACKRGWVQQAAVDYAGRMKAGKDALARIIKNPALGLKEGDENSQYVTRSVTLFKAGAQNDAENLEMLKTALQAGAMIKEDAQPDEALYNRTRQLVGERVRKVLDCDVDGLAGLSDEELLVRAPILNALSMDSMYVDDLMKLSHPSQAWINRKPMTLKDDLVAQRGREYSYKVSMLRGLAERARGLALLRQGENGALTPEACLTDAERQKLGGKSIAEFAAQREQMGARQIESARERYRAVTTPGTPEFQEWLGDLMLKSAHQRSVHSMKFNAVVRELEAEDTPETQAIMDRVRHHAYCSLAYSEEELEEKHLPGNIGEAIFRSFENFLSLRAAEKVLTPEAFRTMVIQLGAGSGVNENTPPEERQAAIQENNKGLITYKKVLAAQYDMIERKYGDMLEHLDFNDVCLHYTDMAKDFCDIQVHLNMTTKYPDLFDPDDPADVLLQQRINYYAVLGNSALGSMSIRFMGLGDKEHQAVVQQDLQGDGCRQGREYLQSRNADFHRTAVDWKQDVQVPAGGGATA